MAAFTSTTNGNWNDGATWGNDSPGTPGTDFPITTGGDTFTVAAGHEVTIPSGHSTKSSGSLATSLTGDHGKLIIVGTLTLDADLVMHAYTEFVMSAGATFDLDGNDLIKSDASTQRHWIDINGTSGSRCTFKSTTNGGTIAISADAGGTAWHNTNIQYCDFENVGRAGVITFGEDIDSGYEFVLNYCTFDVNCGSVRAYSGSNNIDPNCDFEVTHNVFKNKDGTDTRFIAVRAYTTPGATKKREINYNVFDATETDNASVYLYFEGGDFIGNHCRNLKIVQSTRGNVEISDNFLYYNQINDVFQLEYGALFEDNYVYIDIDNPKAFLFNSAFGEAKITIQNNIIEQVGTAGTNGNCIRIPGTDLDVIGNIIFDNSGGCLATALATEKVGDYLFKNNTCFFPTSDEDGMLFKTESSGYVSGTNQLYNNLLVNTKLAITPYGIEDVTGTTDTVTYTDYNGFDSDGNAFDKYYNVTITDKTEGVTEGFGLYDVDADPQFVDNTRKLSVWDDYLGGAGTVANAVTEMLKLNQSGYDTDYTVANLLTYVRAGFAPQNAAYDGTGKDSADIGAVEYQAAGVGGVVKFIRRRKTVYKQ